MPPGDWVFPEESWLIAMRVKEMRFQDISTFLDRPELDIASRYFELVPFFASQANKNQATRYKPYPNQKPEAVLSRDNSTMELSRAMSSLVLSIRSVSLTVTTIDLMYEPGGNTPALGPHELHQQRAQSDGQPDEGTHWVSRLLTVIC
jgi:hypothetical protein